MSKSEVFELSVKVGNDNGNSEHDLVINGEIIQEPNVFAKVNNLPNLEELDKDNFVKNIHENLIISLQSKAVNDGAANNYFVGKYAMKSGRMLRNIEVGAFNSKVNSDIPFVNTPSQIAGYAVKKMLEEGKDLKELHVAVDMTTALPVTQYSKDNANQFSHRYMDNEFELTVHVPNDSYKVKITFDYVKTLPESVPSVFYLQHAKDTKIFDIVNKEYEKLVKEGKVKKAVTFNSSFFKNKKILHSAIGEGTTENPLTEDIRFDPNFIKGTNNGVGHAIKDVLNEFIQRKNLIKFSRQDFSSALRDPKHKYHDEAKEIIEVPLEEQAEIIYRNTVDEAAKANNDVDIIMVHGGGSILMEQYLKNSLLDFSNTTEIALFYVPSDYAVALESLGMYEFTNGKIFKELKAASKKTVEA